MVGLALWLLAEQARAAAGAGSAWPGLAGQLLGRVPNTPLLWEPDLRAKVLKGSPVLRETEERLAALAEEWGRIEAALAAEPDPGAFPGAVFALERFLEAFAVILARSVYLPSAQCFALVPDVVDVERSSKGACMVDFDLDQGAVTVVAKRSYKPGETLAIMDDRPNSERVLVLGEFEEGNPQDCLLFDAELIPADQLYQVKEQILGSFGYGPQAAFPVYEDRMPLQYLAYLRLARVQDSAQLARVTFEEDVLIDESNEYEILQLVMGDCRERLAEYEQNEEYDVVLLDRGELSPIERLGIQQRLAEKKILRKTMDTIRRRLAPIRGIPTKTGTMEDPNQDITEMFDQIENVIPNAKAAVDNFFSWARGDMDPEWRKGPRQRKQKSPPPKPW